MFDPRRPTLRYRIDRGDCLGVVWLALGSVALVEIAARARPDAIVLDLQHGLWERTDLEAALGRAPPDVPVMVRVAENSPRAIGEALDAGAEGVIVPLVETAKAGRKAVRAARFPPHGSARAAACGRSHDFAAYVEGCRARDRGDPDDRDGAGRAQRAGDRGGRGGRHGVHRHRRPCAVHRHVPAAPTPATRSPAPASTPPAAAPGRPAASSRWAWRPPSGAGPRLSDGGDAQRHRHGRERLRAGDRRLRGAEDQARERRRRAGPGPRRTALRPSREPTCSTRRKPPDARGGVMSAAPLLPRAPRLRRGAGRDPGPVAALHADPPGRADGHLPPPARAVPERRRCRRSPTRSSSRAPTAPAPTAPITAPTARALAHLVAATAPQLGWGFWRFEPPTDGSGSPSPTAPSPPATVGRTSRSAIPIVGMLRAVSTLVFGREGEARKAACAACGADACRFEARPREDGAMTDVVDGLRAALGPDRVRTGADIPARNHADASGLDPTPPAALLLPRSTEEVSAALKICHAHRRPVVTQGRLDRARRRRASARATRSPCPWSA